MADPVQNIYTTIAKVGKGTTGSAMPSSYTGIGSQRIAQVEPQYLELVRSTRLFTATLAQVTNGTVPLTNIPTTAPSHGLFNNAPLGSPRCIVPVHIATTYASGTAGAAGLTLFCGVSANVLASLPTANSTGWTIQANRGTGTSVGLVTTAPTFPSGTSWALLDGGGFASGTTVTGPGKGFRLDGMFLVPPQFSFGFGVISDTGTTAKWCYTVIFAEIEVDLDT